MPVDTFTGLVLGYGGAGTPGLPTGPRPAWAPSPMADLHAGGAVMWVGGDAIMFGLMMLVFLMWSMDDRAATSGHGWLESARQGQHGHPGRLASARRAAGLQPGLASEASAEGAGRPG